MHKKHLARLLAACISAITAIAMFDSFSRASALSPGYTQFAGCPGGVDPAVELETENTVCSRFGGFNMGVFEVHSQKAMDSEERPSGAIKGLRKEIVSQNPFSGNRITQLQLCLS